MPVCTLVEDQRARVTIAQPPQTGEGSGRRHVDGSPAPWIGPDLTAAHHWSGAAAPPPHGGGPRSSVRHIDKARDHRLEPHVVLGLSGFRQPRQNRSAVETRGPSSRDLMAPPRDRRPGPALVPPSLASARLLQKKLWPLNDRRPRASRSARAFEPPWACIPARGSTVQPGRGAASTTKRTMTQEVTAPTGKSSRWLAAFASQTHDPFSLTQADLGSDDSWE